MRAVNEIERLPVRRHRTNAQRRRVVIIQRRMTQYRIDLFELMREDFDKTNIELAVVYGDPTPVEQKKMDSAILSWGVHVPCTYLFNRNVCWQNSRAVLRGADLVVVPQENKLTYNLLLLTLPRRFKLAFWGHGANLQSNSPKGFKERFKRWTTNQVDWWFAYTQMSADLVTTAGFPARRITVLNNAVDTAELHRHRKALTPNVTQALRQSLGFGEGPVGVYVGSLYADKRLDFLFAAAEAIRSKVPDFHLLILGDGPESDAVQAWCAVRPWARWVGAQFGAEKVAYLSMAQVMLNPGAVGLGILDAFVCGVPMLTTDCCLHGPEIAYLETGINGVMTPNDLGAYIEASVHLLEEARVLDSLVAGCAASAHKYTVSSMARNFVDGVIDCLEAPIFHTGVQA